MASEGSLAGPSEVKGEMQSSSSCKCNQPLDNDGVYVARVLTYLLIIILSVLLIPGAIRSDGLERLKSRRRVACYALRE